MEWVYGNECWVDNGGKDTDIEHKIDKVVNRNVTESEVQNGVNIGGGIGNILSRGNGSWGGVPASGHDMLFV